MKWRTLEEVDELFEKRVRVFEFKTYRTEIQEKALQDVQVDTEAFLDKKPSSNSCGTVRREDRMIIASGRV